MIPEDLQVPGYDILERIGRGGMASVYRARQHTFDRDVALKVLKPDLSEDELFCQRFVQESLIVAKLHHSNIVQVYDVGEFQTKFFIAMEYLHGGDLHQRLNRGLKIEDTIKIIKQCASALDFAHKKGIVHRDIKPDNIMFREDGAAVITDFGIAKELDSDMHLTQTGLIVGTPRYMAPEQIKGHPATPQADIYSLGILLFQCLTNHVPFQGKDMISTAYKHFNAPIPKLPPLVAALQPIVEAMLAKNPQARYQRAEDIVAALEALDNREQKRQQTNLDITKEFRIPADTKPQKHDEHLAADEETAIAPSLPDGGSTIPQRKSAATNSANHTGIHTANESRVTQIRTLLFGYPKAKWGISGFIAVFAVLYLMITLVGDGSLLDRFIASNSNDTTQIATTDNTQGPPTVQTQQPSGESQTTPSVETINPTVARLLAEAQQDIQQKRLKKPDANNAFNKLERVLAIEPNNKHAQAGLEQIAEEYAKLAEAALLDRKFALSAAYLDHARSASPSLNLVAIIQTKLDQALRSTHQQHASIISMEKSLMIDGLLKSAAIDEDEGRLFSPAGDNANEKYQRILELDPEHPLAKEKIATIR